MHIDKQLKRGYIALFGMGLLALTAMTAPDFSESVSRHVFPKLDHAACTAKAKSSWRLASTPIDIQPILLRKAMICRA
ncbi:MAG TPA: hypothetical protein PLF92_12025 [Arenimonas sp.]|jgi:hypothetical protein|nr:hypothetical protein [Arenimonas sp.]HPW33627.1 hypothetical protein [Arenimonas sp.]